MTSSTIWFGGRWWILWINEFIHWITEFICYMNSLKYSLTSFNIWVHLLLWLHLFWWNNRIEWMHLFWWNNRMNSLEISQQTLVNSLNKLSQLLHEFTEEIIVNSLNKWSQLSLWIHWMNEVNYYMNSLRKSL